ncbi:hypothetical protein D3C80_1647380 [compost metagenome]
MQADAFSRGPGVERNNAVRAVDDRGVGLERVGHFLDAGLALIQGNVERHRSRLGASLAKLLELIVVTHGYGDGRSLAGGSIHYQSIGQVEFIQNQLA